MLGFGENKGVEIQGEYRQQLIDMLDCIRNGNYMQEHMDRLHFDNVTPDVFVMKEGETMDPKCKYCDEIRGGRCKGRNYIKDQEDCEKFHNRWDDETCKYCLCAQPIDGDDKHIFCPKKNEKMNVKGWCIYQEKEWAKNFK